MEILKAFFYDYKYYLFPESCLSLSDIKKQNRLYVKRLKEDKCMAPHFVYENIVSETLEIEDPNRIFEIEAKLYTQQEYDEILGKLVNQRCVGCERYEDDGTNSLNGHHREMSLDGVCYEREEKDEYWSFGYCVKYVWYRLSKRIKELESYIDKGNQKKLNLVINSELNRIYYPVNFYGVKQNGKYNLYCSVATGSLMHATIVNYIATVANCKNSPIKEAGWEVFPFIPSGIKKVKFKQKAYTVGCEYTENPSCVALTIYHPKAKTLKSEKALKMLEEIMGYLCAELGEDVARTVIESYNFVDVKQNILSFDELKSLITSKYEQYYKSETGEKAPFPTPVGYGLKEDDEHKNEILPYRSLIREGSSVAPDASLVDFIDLKEKPWWIKMASFIYIYVPRAIDGPENAFATLSWYMANTNLIPEPLRNPDEYGVAGISIGVAECAEHGFIVDSLIMDEKKFYRSVRAMAPALRAYNAKMVVVNENGIISYNCDYVITPTEIF